MTDLTSHALAGLFTSESPGKPNVALISWLKCSANQILSPLRTERSVLVFCWSPELQVAKCRDVALCYDWTRVLVLAPKAVSKPEMVRQPLKGLREGPHQIRPLPPGKAQAQESLRREVYTPQFRTFCTGDTSISQQWPALVTWAPRKWSWVITDKDKGNPWAKHATFRPAGHFLYSQEFRQQTNARDFSPSFNLLHSTYDHQNILWIRNQLENLTCVPLFLLST